MRLRTAVMVAVTVACCGLGGAGVVSSPACNLPAKTVARDVVSAEQTACVWANAHLPIPAIQAACAIADVAAEVVQAIVDDFFAHRPVLALYIGKYESAKREKEPFPSLTAEPPKRSP